MKITVRHDNTEITISEEGAKDGASIQWGDQNKHIQETLIVMAEQVKKLMEAVK